MKTLDIIQKLFKVGKIFSKIIYICCIVGFCGCAVGAVAMIVGAETLKIGGVTLHGILETEAGVSTGTIWAAIAVGACLCVGEFFVARMAYRYFENELNAGTPFSFDGAKELLNLGISTIWIPIVAAVLAQIAQGVIGQFAENVEKVSVDGFDSVAWGVMFILISLFCKYGAECKENKVNDVDEEK